MCCLPDDALCDYFAFHSKFETDTSTQAPASDLRSKLPSIMPTAWPNYPPPLSEVDHIKQQFFLDFDAIVRFFLVIEGGSWNSQSL